MNSFTRIIDYFYHYDRYDVIDERECSHYNIDKAIKKYSVLDFLIGNMNFIKIHRNNELKNYFGVIVNGKRFKSIHQK